MKNIKYFISILFVALALGCSDDSNDTGFADNATAPTNITALFTIANDNSGLVTVAPFGEGATAFEIHFADSTAEFLTVAAGEKATHTYAEGTYSVRIIAIGINGKRTEADFPLTVSFLAPQDLTVAVTNVVGNPLKVNVTASATYATYYVVDFGDGTEAVQFNEGDTATHTYAAIGTYTVTVTAHSGGVETSTYTQEVIISNPLNLPVDFESPGLNYAFTTFGGAVASAIDNPHVSGINTSAKVGSMTPAGAQWTGAYLTMDSPINMTNKYFKVKVWSPQAGVPVLLKLENLTDANTSAEHTATTTVANDWEELLFNFTGANGSYSKVTLFFNAGNSGTGDTYYFDDIKQSASGIDVALPITFENSALNYAFSDFQGAVTSVVANPNASGINTSANVMKMLKSAGSQIWAGSYKTLVNPIDFSTMHTVKMKVYSPAAGLPVIFKFENGTESLNIERSATTTVANQWEELSFNFDNIVNANNYKTITVFLNAGMAGTGDVYYFDDIKLAN